MKKNCSYIIFLLFSKIGFGQTIKYIAPWGVDAITSGTLIKPYKTIQFANSQNSGVGTITFKLKPGIYYETASINILSNRNIEKDSIGTVIIDASNRDSSIAFKHIFAFNGVSNNLVKGITFRNLIGPSAKVIFVLGNTKNLTIRDCKFKNIGWTKSIYLSRRPPNNQTVASPIYIHGTTLDSIYNVNLIYNEIDSCCLGWAEALTIKGNTSKFLVDSNTISRVSNIGIDIAGNFDTSFFTPNLRIYNHARFGVISNNKVSFCMSGIKIAAGIYLDGSRNCIVENNIVSRCGSGFSVGAEEIIPTGGSVGNHIIRNNIVDSCSTSGMYIGSGVLGRFVKKSTVVNNTFTNNCTSEKVNGVDSILDFFNVPQPIEFWTNSSKGTILLQNNDSTTLNNNIITILPTRTAITGMGDLVSSNFKSNYNLYHTSNTNSQSLFYFTGVHTMNGNAVPNLPFNSITAFTSTTQQDSSSIFANPLFLNTSPHPYKPNQCSPAINKGNPVYNIGIHGAFDIISATRNFQSRIDIGAFEYQLPNTPCAFNFTSTTAVCDSLSNKVTLRWTKPTNADSFKVVLNPNIVLTTTSDTTYLHQPTSGGTFIYNVIAKNSTDTLKISTTVSLPNCVKSFTLDTVIAKCKNDTALAEIKWSASTNATGYSIYRNNTLHKNIIGGNVTSFTDTILNGQTYSYKIRATNSLGGAFNTNGTKSVNNTLCPSSFSLNFVNPQCNNTQSEMNISWSPSANATKYSIYRDTGNVNPTTYYKQITSTNFSDTVTTFKRYSYKIRAISIADSVFNSNNFISQQAINCINTNTIFINSIPLEFKLFPSPASNSINLMARSSNLFTIKNIRIFDSKGAIHLQRNLNKTGTQIQETIDIRPFPSGNYQFYARVSINNQTKIIKIQFVKL